MRKILKYSLIATFILMGAVLTSCVKDRGEYDYKDIAEYTTTGYDVIVNGVATPLMIGNKIVLSTNDRIEIKVNGEVSGDFTPTYKWKLFLKTPPMDLAGNYEPAKLLTETKDFNVEFAEAPGKYVLYFEITNQNNKTAFYETFEVEVESIKGLLVYEQGADGKGDYSAVRTAEMNMELPETKLGVIRNIYSSSNDGAKIDNPTKLWVRSIGADRGYSAVVYLGSKNNVVTVNYESHTLETDKFAELFLVAPQGEPNPQLQFNGTNDTEYMINNGEMHKIEYINAPARSIFSPSAGNAGKKYASMMVAIPMLFVSQDDYRVFANVLFNVTDRKFEYDSFMINAFGNGGGTVDITDTKMDLIYMDHGTGEFFDAVMKDDAGKLHYVRFNIRNLDQVMSTDNDLSAHTQITENSLWAIGERGEVAFATANNDVVSYNYLTNTMTSANLRLPENATITVLEVLKDKDNATFDNAVLYVGYDVAGEGVLLQYEFNPVDGTINKASKKEFTGFGKILDVVLKK